MHEVLQQTDTLNSLADNLGKMHIKIAQEVLRMKAFSNDTFEKRPQIACLIAHDLHATDQTGLTDGHSQTVSFGTQALPVEDARKGFVSHQNLRNFLTTVRYSLQRGLRRFPYNAALVSEKLVQ